MVDHTIDIGHVHVGDPDAINREGTWVCAANCPHPDHQTLPPRGSLVSFVVGDYRYSRIIDGTESPWTTLPTDGAPAGWTRSDVRGQEDQQ